MNQPLNEVKIDYSQKWERKYLNSIQQAYAKAPYLKDYFCIIKYAIEQNFETLGQLNIELLTWLLEEFGYKGKVILASQLDIDPSLKATDLLVEICKKGGATTYLSGVSGADYLELDKFKEANINVEFQQFFHPVYKQLHGDFIPNLSAIDLLFNYGPDAHKVLNCHGGDILRLILEEIPDWEDKKVLEMFGGNGRGHLNFYGHRVKDLSIWEINSNNCENLLNLYPHAKICNGDSFQEVLTIAPTYDIIVVDAPASLDCSPLYYNLHEVCNNEAVIILRAIKKSWNNNPDIMITESIEEVARKLKNLKVSYMQAFEREYYYSDKPWLENYVFFVEKQ